MTESEHGRATANRSLDSAVVAAINAAKSAALKAGIGLHPDSSHEDDKDEPHSGPKVSFAFELDGLASAPSVAIIEDAIEEIPGVSASIVYPSSIAWVTAPEKIDPDLVVAVFKRFDVKAQLTTSTLYRRSQRLHPDAGREARLERYRNRLNSRRVSPQVRKHAIEEELTSRKARDSGWLSGARRRGASEDTGVTGDVLFTARALITPLRLWLSLPLALIVLVISVLPSWQFDYWQWAIAVISIPVVTWAAWPFHRAAVGGIRRGLSALDAASSVAIIAAYIWSMCMLLFTRAGEPGWRSEATWFMVNHVGLSENEVFFDVACGMTVLLLAGRLMTRRSSQSGLLAELDGGLVPPQQLVTVVRRGVEKLEIPMQEVRFNDDVIVKPGEIIPVDGVIIGGGSTIAASLIMGQDQRAVKVKDRVYAGGLNIDNEIKVRTSRTGHRTRIAAMRRWVKEATMRENRHNQASLKSAGTLVPVAFTLAVVDFCLWALISGNINAGFITALAILAGVGPVCLALSTALATRNSVEAAARHGILVRSGEILRLLDDVDTTIFNRVGTLTDGEMTVETITADKGEDPELILRVAGALARESEHTVSKALVKAAREARDAGTGNDHIPHWIDVSHADITDDGSFHGHVELPIADAEGVIHKRPVDALLWRPRSMTEVRATLSPRLASAAVSGGAPLVVRWKGKDRGVITLQDHPRPDASDAIVALDEQGIDTVMLSRDTYPVARRYADSLGITNVLAGIAPGKKPQAVRSVHTRGSTVAMVGDSSVLDCLRVADVGLLMGVADPKELRDDSDDPAADVIFLRDEVFAVPRLYRLARRYVRLVNGNIALAWSYNVLVVALAFAGLLHPMAATVLMLASSQIIEWRSRWARRF